jgi:hypothetical protein
MLGKICLLILVGACTAAGVLAIRQQRLVAMHDMARSVERSAELDRKLWRVRADIAASITPGKVRTMVGSLGELKPIPIYWNPPPVSEQLKDPALIGEGNGGGAAAAGAAPKSKPKSSKKSSGSRVSEGSRREH